MINKARILAAFIVLSLLVGMWRLFPSTPEVLPFTGAPSAPAEVGGLDGEVPVPDAADDDDRLPVEVPGQLEDREAEVRVIVRWEDGRLVNGVGVLLLPRGTNGILSQRMGLTGTDGTAVFRPVRPGRVQVSTDRGGRETLTVAEREVHVAEITIPKGLHVGGRVTNLQDQPIPDARIWLSYARQTVSRGFEIAKTDHDGAFEVENVEPGRLISAFAEGYQPAAVQPVEGNLGLEVLVEIKLAPAKGSVQGIVFGPDGEPAENSLLLLGSEFPSNIGLRFDRYRVGPTRVLLTDADGRFYASGFRLGFEIPVWARLPDSAVWRGDVQPAEPATFVSIHLQTGAGMHGTVWGGQGEPADRAQVTVLHDAVEPEPGMGYVGPSWGRISGRTDSQGRYALSGIPPGRIKLRVRSGPLVQTEEFELRDQELREWNPILNAGLTIVGRVVNQAGYGLPGYRVSARGEKLVWPPSIVDTLRKPGPPAARNLAVAPGLRLRDRAAPDRQRGRIRRGR